MARRPHLGHGGQHAADVLALDDDWLCAAPQARTPRPLQYSLKAELDVKSVEAMQRVIPQLSSAACLKLLKALYGTKQASYLWQQTLSKWLLSQERLDTWLSVRHMALRYSRTYAVPDCLSEHADSIRDNGGMYAFSDSTWTAPKSTCGYVVFSSGGPIAASFGFRVPRVGTVDSIETKQSGSCGHDECP